MKGSPIIGFFSRPEPIFFCLRLVILAPVLAFATLLPLWDRWAVKPLILANAWSAEKLLRILGAAPSRDGPLISSGSFSMEVVSGCTGLFVFLFLAAAMVSFPARWSARLAGIAGGAAVIALLNQIRLVTLFFVGIRYPKLFEEIHVYLWQGVVILAVLLFWYAWARRALRGLEPSPPRA